MLSKEKSNIIIKKINCSTFGKIISYDAKKSRNNQNKYKIKILQSNKFIMMKKHW